MTQYGNELYCSVFGDNKVIKFDHTATTPTAIDVATGLDGPNGIVFKNNYLIITEGNDTISRADINDATLEFIPIVTDGLSNPQQLLVDGNDLYIADNQGSRLAKADLSSIGIDELQNNTSWSVFPNPTTESIQIKGITEAQAYTIKDIAGKEVASGTIQPGQDLDVQTLVSGQYVLQIGETSQLKFVKQ